jgi:hypothetical protein
MEFLDFLDFLGFPRFLGGLVGVLDGWNTRMYYHLRVFPSGIGAGILCCISKGLE